MDSKIESLHLDQKTTDQLVKYLELYDKNRQTFSAELQDPAIYREVSAELLRRFRTMSVGDLLLCANKYSTVESLQTLAQNYVFEKKWTSDAMGSFPELMTLMGKLRSPKKS